MYYYSYSRLVMFLVVVAAVLLQPTTSWEYLRHTKPSNGWKYFTDPAFYVRMYLQYWKRVSYPERLILSSVGWEIESSKKMSTGRSTKQKVCLIDLKLGPKKNNPYQDIELLANREYTVLRTTSGSSLHYPIDFDHVTKFRLELDIATSAPECQPQMWRYGDWQALIPLVWRFGTWQDMMLDEITFDRKTVQNEDGDMIEVYSMSLDQGPLVSGSYVMYLPPHPTKEKVEPVHAGTSTATNDEILEGERSDEQQALFCVEDVQNASSSEDALPSRQGTGIEPVHNYLESRKLRSMFESSDSAQEPEIDHMYAQLLARKNLEYDTTVKCEYRMLYIASSEKLPPKAPLRVEAHFDKTVKDCAKVKLPTTSL